MFDENTFRRRYGRRHVRRAVPGEPAGRATDPFAQRTFCSWDEAGWRSLLLQRFTHAPVVEDAYAPPTADQRIVLITAGRPEVAPVGRTPGLRGSFRAGQLLLGVPGEPARLRHRSDAPVRTLQVHLPAPMLRRVADGLHDAVSPVVAVPGTGVVAVDDPIVTHLLQALDRAADVGAEPMYAETAAEFLAVHLLTRYRRGAEYRQPLHEDARVRQAIALMRERTAEQITLADLAEHVGLSVYHFVRVFRAATGQTPHRFLVGLRLERAKQLLTRPDLTLDEVAAACGFGSAAHLWAAFKRETGQSPSDFRAA